MNGCKPVSIHISRVSRKTLSTLELRVDTGRRGSPRCVAQVARDEIARRAKLRRYIGEVVLYGSLVRGDFDPRISYVDFFTVIRDSCAARMDSLVNLLKRLFEEAAGKCLGAVPARDVDAAWCFESELGGGCDYKFLTIYRDDFEDHNIIVWGTPSTQ